MKRRKDADECRMSEALGNMIRGVYFIDSVIIDCILKFFNFSDSM